MPEVLIKPSLYPYPALSDSEVPPTPVFSRNAPPSAAPSTVPISIAITQWHWVLLYSDRVVGVSRENEKVVWEEMLPLVSPLRWCRSIILIVQGHDEKALGLSADPISKTFWIYTDRSILEILVQNEDRDVWRAKLEKGDFASALTFARVSHI
jgi:hypothetical protein